MELIHAFSVSLQAVWADSGFIAFTIVWRSTLYQGEEIDALARALVDLRLKPPVTRFDEDLRETSA